jgi:hypothetical protein
MVTKPITVGLKYMTPEQRRAYQAQKQREYANRYNQKLRERGEYRKTAKDKREERLAAGRRGLEIKAQAAAAGITVTIRDIAGRLGMKETSLGAAMREAQKGTNGNQETQ